LSSDTSSVRTPYLSVVVATRNDDHGGDPLKRLQAFINTFAAQCRRASLDAEVIVVEWNPPADRPRVSELCRVPMDAPFPVRFVEVPAQLHQRLRFSSVLPLFQMIAKNVGIRRANGRFVLATNIDIIFSNELVEHLASRCLTPGQLYRVDRHDIEPDFPVDGGLADQMAYCRSHHLRIHTRLGTYPVDSLGRSTTLAPDIVGSTNITFVSGWHTREGDVTYGFYRWVTNEARLAIDRHGTAERGVVLDIELEPNPYQPESWVEVEILDGARQLARAVVSRRICLRVPLDDGRSHHELVLRMIDSSGGRESLPLFESRDEMCYRVFGVSLGPIAVNECSMDLWRRAPNNNPLLSIQHTPSGVEITSDPGSYSHCAQYGPFESPADDTYEFQLEYVPVAGQLAFKVMDDDRESWLPARAFEIVSGEIRSYGLSVHLPRGTRFSLFVANSLPAGGVSRGVLRRLHASVPPGRLLRKDLRSARPRWAAVLIDVLARPFRWLRSAVTSIEKRRAQRFQEKITDESERVRDLEARVSLLAPLSELEPMARLLREQRPAPLHQNACGDFQLMARDQWFALNGYPEFEMFSMGIDGLLEAVACAAGVKEHLFAMPLCIYHLEHEKGSGWTPEGEAALRKRISESGITWLDSTTVHTWTTYMQWLRRPMIFNGPGWGLGDVALPEKTLGQIADNDPAHVIGDVG
jgi:hypothetical protein